MKKIYLAFMLTCAGLYNANAQVNVGGFPWSMSHKEVVGNDRVPLTRLNTPDFDKALKEDEANPEKPGKYRVALAVNTDISLKNSGVFTYLPDGSKIWRMQLSVPTSKGIKMSYDNFQLPEGVVFFVQNGNFNQLIGGFDASSNVEDKVMGHEMVQGDVVNLEMNIAAGVNINDIGFNVTKVYAVYRSSNYLEKQFSSNPEQVADVGSANACHVNAVCKIAEPWERLMKTVAHIWITDGETGGWCSGNLINNTAKDCKPLFLTASHCDGEVGTDNSHFSKWEFTFDYKTPLCSGGGSPKDNKMIMGANFVARSEEAIPTGQTSGPLYGDFLLLQIKDPNQKLSAWDLYLGGWDKSGSNTNDSVWVSFHHPAGDAMKFTRMTPLDPNGSFNTDSLGTHWAARQRQGGSEGGSSGSCLFRGSTGMIIGTLSGGGGATCGTTRSNLYSKISYDWEYPKGDGTFATRLKDHLDPLGTGAMNMEMAKLQSCVETPFRLVGLSVSDISELENGLLVYPNPSNGIVKVKVNLAEQTPLTINVYNILGAKCGTFNVKSIRNGDVSLDLSAQPSGMYSLQISSDKGTVSKKLVINK